MMATAAVIGLSAGKRLLSSSFYSSDLNDKLFSVHELGVTQFQAASAKNVIIAKKSNNFGPGVPSNRHTQTIKALKEHVDTSSVPSTDESWQQWTDLLEKDGNHNESSLEVLILLQKSMLEKQWNISFDQAGTLDAPGGVNKKIQITGSGTSARQRRTNSRRKAINQTASLMLPSRRKHPRSIISPELLQGRLTGYVKGISSKDLLSHAEVIHLSNTIKAGISLEEHKSKLQERLGCEPSDEQLVSSLRMSRAELHSKMIECSLARERLAMNNVRLVMSIAQKYDNMGAELADLVQGGLIGLLRGIEKFDSSKGYKISTYVYWWIRQKIAESLKMSQKKVRNATEAISKVFSLDREAFPTLNGLPGETLHSYIADNNLENNPWHGFDEWSLKDEVNKLISTTLGERERDIIRLYYGLDKESHTWEDISRQFGLSRERVRQVGLVALEKLKHAARRRRLEAMLVKH
ncbi:RNA polymerase sigma factor sigA-like isoform X2 [Magnolia sinica]|uniref:RNA polymerase sigma factor sigA-like isoform X2 n=1 Tax=Magnolia sinica TaxID=86752 RepID=UPI002659435E|nr:RNA polymerase sigma factor sigA-like isoform X2 [Magnolia sinica]